MKEMKIGILVFHYIKKLNN